MIHRCLALAFLAVCFAFVGCQKADKRVNMANFDKIQPGMERADIDAMLGRGEDDPNLELLQGSGVAASVGVVDPNSLGSSTPALRWAKWGTDKVYILVCFNRAGKVHNNDFKKQAGLK